MIRPLASLLCLGLAASMAASAAGPRVVALPSKSPLVTIRLVFTTGSASDPAAKPGLANLTGAMLGESGTRDLTYKQIVDALYPMATTVHVYSDKEMTTFVGQTHVDNLDRFYGLMRDMILHPGWRDDDFARVRDNTVNALRVSLRGNNDEELGKEELYNLIYSGHPYGHENLGTAAALAGMTVGDLQGFYKAHYTQANLIIGLAGGYPASFAARVTKDFSALPAGQPDSVTLPAPAGIARNQLTIVAKDTRSVAWSFGLPIEVKRGDPDFASLLVAQSYLGQHRLSSGVLFSRMRELRGLNYGDYAYIEYFPRGMFALEPEPNIARRQQIFQIWIRPVEPANAGFALRAAAFELNKLIEKGMSQADFDRTKTFLSKYVNVLTKSKSEELGYAIDSAYYGIPAYGDYLKAALSKLTVEDVNRALKKHLRADRLQLVAIAKDAVALRTALTSGDPTPVTYVTAKPQEVLDEDKIIERLPLGLRAEDVKIVPVEEVFEK